MNRHSSRTIAWVLLSALTSWGCVCGIDDPPPEPGPMATGESRLIELRSTRFEVERFEKTLNRQDLLALPPALRKQMWLMNLELSGSAARPKLFDEALDAIRALDPESEDLTPAEANLVRLLNMTPHTANLEGTALEPLLELSAKLGFDAADILADAMGIGTTEPFLSTAALKTAILEAVVSSHPHAKWRPGRVDAEHPDGRWLVPPGTLPVTLEDVLADMTTLPERFGRYDDGGVFHPGFLVGATAAELLTDDVEITVQVALNALPFQGIDLSEGALASVNSIGSEPDRLFDFTDPNWLQMSGIVEGGPVVTDLTFAMLRSPAFPAAATSPVPWPTGNGEVWNQAPWTLESVVARASTDRWGDWSVTQTYQLGENPTPVATLSIADGWLEAMTTGDVGEPPEPGYLWDTLLEVVDRRLVDGVAPDQTPADQVAFTLEDLPVGLSPDEVVATLKDNLRGDATALVTAARYLFSNASGDADLFYVHTPPDVTADKAGDWLFFVSQTDVRLDTDGQPVRDHDLYATPGFFADAGLTQSIGDTAPLMWDRERIKVRIQTGDTLYVADDQGGIYRLDVLDKPGKYTCALRMERLQ